MLGFIRRKAVYEQLSYSYLIAKRLNEYREVIQPFQIRTSDDFSDEAILD